MLNSKNIKEKINNAMRNPLIKNMIIVGVITLVIKVLAFYKETIIAGAFGLNDVLDTFFVAILIPTFIQSVFINSLRNIFVPNYISDMKADGNKGSFQAIILLITIGISLVSALLTLLFVDYYLALVYPGHTEAYYQLAKDQLYIVLPCLIFWGISTVMGGLLEISNRFLVSTISGLVPLLTMIIFLIFLKDYFGDYVLAIGTLVGSFLGFIYLAIFAIKYGDFTLSKPKMNENSRLMLRQLPPKISSSFLSSMNNHIDQFFAGSLIVGSIGALNYGNRVPAFGVTIVIMALGSVLLPHFSRMVNEDLKAAYHQLFRALKNVFAITIILAAIGFFASDWIIETWLERREFTHQDTLKVSAIQQILLVNIPFYICTLIMVKFLTSINKNSFMAWISLVNLVINIILNIILIKYYDVYGLAASTSLVLILSSLFYFGYTYKQYKKISQ